MFKLIFFLGFLNSGFKVSWVMVSLQKVSMSTVFHTLKCLNDRTVEDALITPDIVSH